MQSQIPVVDGVVVMGIQVPRSEERLLRKVMRVSILISFFYVVYLIGSITEYSKPENNTTSSQWMGLVLFILLCGVGVPMSGYFGAKNRAPSMLQTFCVGEGCVACSNTFSIFTTFANVFWAVNTYCNSDDCELQFVNETKCVTAARRQVGSSSRRSSRTVTISKAICDDPWGDWYLWFVLLFCGTMAVLGCFAMVNSWNLRNRLLGGTNSPRVQHYPTPVSRGPVATQAVIVNRTAPPLPQTAGETKVEMVPVVSDVRMVAPGSFDHTKVLVGKST